MPLPVYEPAPQDLAFRQYSTIARRVANSGGPKQDPAAWDAMYALRFTDKEHAYLFAYLLAFFARTVTRISSCINHNCRQVRILCTDEECEWAVRLHELSFDGQWKVNKFKRKHTCDGSAARGKRNNGYLPQVVVESTDIPDRIATYMKTQPTLSRRAMEQLVFNALRTVFEITDAEIAAAPCPLVAHGVMEKVVAGMFLS